MPPPFIMQVPMIKQDRDMSCWYAAASMVAFFYEPGPRVGMPHVYAANDGLHVDLIEEFAAKEGLAFLDEFSTHWEPDEMKRALLLNGPLWCHGNFGPGGAGHVVVAIGVNAAGQVVYNDPDPATGMHASVMEVEDFCRAIGKDYNANHGSNVLYKKKGWYTRPKN